MTIYTAGRFTADVWTGGYPVQIVVSDESGNTIRLRHSEISDLAYVVKRALKDARRQLEKNDRGEV